MRTLILSKIVVVSRWAKLLLILLFLVGDPIHNKSNSDEPLES
jgi:hypothetical protein